MEKYKVRKELTETVLAHYLHFILSTSPDSVLGKDAINDGPFVPVPIKHTTIDKKASFGLREIYATSARTAFINLTSKNNSN